jgi:hypothetical protein
MALAPTSRAIGAVTNALITRITLRTGITVSSNRPDQNSGNRHLNLFLYEIGFDPTLKNIPLDEGQKPPLWMVLKYLLTAFDTNGNSDSPEAHEDLGAGLRAIHEDDLLKLNGLPATVVQALEDNPSELHTTFDESPSDLLAKLMQGTDEKLRISAAFQVRPVMIASTEPAEYSLLVGIDYTQTPPIITPKYVGLDVLPSLGAVIESVQPNGFEVGEEITIRGTDLNLSNMVVRLGAADLPITMQRPDELKFMVDGAAISAAGMSAGSHPLTLVQTLKGTGKQRASNMFVANLVPTLTAANVLLPVSTAPTPPPPPRMVFATIDLTGILLGANTDDAVVALYRDGKVFRMFDVLTLAPGPPPPAQTARRIVMTASQPVEEGEYLVILRVNSQQAPQSPKVILV